MARRKIAQAQKQRAVQDWISGKRTGAQICRDEKITSGQLSAWRAQIAPDATTPGRKNNAPTSDPVTTPPTAAPPETPPHLPPAVIQPEKGKRTPPHVQYQLAYEYKGGARNGGRKAGEIAKDAGVSAATILAWWQKWKDQPPPPSATDIRNAHAQSPHDIESARAFVELQEALALMHMIECPSCHARFTAQPPGLAESLVTVAAHRLDTRRRR